MIAFPSTLRQLRDAIDGMIEATGDAETVIGAGHIHDGRLILDFTAVELVYIDGSGYIVGDEANDYRPKPGERAAVRIS